MTPRSRSAQWLHARRQCAQHDGWWMVVSAEGGSGWSMRVVPNKFPVVIPGAIKVHNLYALIIYCTAVRCSVAPAPHNGCHGFTQISDRDKSVFSDAIALNNQYPATGHHEVLIETNHHNLCTARTNEQHVRRVAWAWRQRGNVMPRATCDAPLREGAQTRAYLLDRIHYIPLQGGRWRRTRPWSTSCSSRTKVCF
jgi:galactose-1-phosphate uridylyltransferase